MASPPSQNFCPEVFDHLQSASVQLQRASVLSDHCFALYRRAKLLVPRPAEQVPPLDGVSLPKGLSPHWIALQQELLSLQEAAPNRRYEKKRSAEPPKNNDIKLVTMTAETTPFSTSMSSASPQHRDALVSDSSSSDSPPQPAQRIQPARPKQKLPQLRLDKAGRGAWLGGDATAGETYAR